MGRKSLSGGVVAVGTSRIRFDFVLEGARYRPSLPIVPTEMNLRRARVRLNEMKQRIAQGVLVRGRVSRLSVPEKNTS